MTATERRAAVGLASIVSLRMLGLFLIFPVFALYAEGLAGVTPALVGIAIGAYGLTQAFLQVPFGMLSDRLGRKPVIAAGLLLFAAGSVLAAVSDSIWGVIAGRMLQGSGAVAAAVMALAADLTREEQRTKAMAIIGMSIGVSFMLALVLGPVLNGWIGVPGIFGLTAVLALLGIVLLFTGIPTPAQSRVHRDAEPVLDLFGRVLRDTGLLRLDFGIFALHMILTAVFLVVPLALRDSAGIDVGQHWMVYLPVLLLSVALMIPLVVQAERKGRMPLVFPGAIGLLAIALAGLAFGGDGVWRIGAWMTVFFTGFNVLEATLPSLVSRLAPADSKGTAMGVYSTSQFAGAFAGGALGGWLHQAIGAEAVYLLGVAMALLWLFSVFGMRFPAGISSRLLHVEIADESAARTLEARLQSVPGVVEARVIVEDETAYLKVDRRRLDEAALGAIAAGAA
jgi:MFS family permease